MASEADRKRRLLLLVGAVLAAALVVVVLIVVSQGGDDDEPAPAADGGAEPAGLFDGIPQQGIRLGRPDAPLRMIEFADLQCPFCAEYSQEVLPDIVERYVRPGDLSLELHTLTFLGEDSVKAGLAASAAAEQNRMWQFTEVFFRDQGAENSGFVTPGFIRDVAREAGARPAPIVAASESAGTDRLLTEAEREATRLGVEGTPSFYVSRGDGPLEPLEVTELTPDAFAEQLDSLLGG